MAARAGLDREMVVQAAANMADKEGWENISLATLAAQLGVRTPTLYHYVKEGLSGLKRELALYGLREAAKRLGRAVMGKAGDEAVIALAEAYRTFAHERPGLYEATTHAASPDDEELQAASWEVLDIALRALSAYQLSQEDALHAIRMLRSFVHGCVTLEAAGGFGMPLEVDETFRRLIAMYIHYLHTPDETMAINLEQRPR
jgi:AcrR family transcriptional regulator